MGLELAQLNKHVELKSGAKVRVVEAVLTDASQKFAATSDQVSFLSGDSAAIASAIANSFKVPDFVSPPRFQEIFRKAFRDFLRNQQRHTIEALERHLEQELFAYSQTEKQEYGVWIASSIETEEDLEVQFCGHRLYITKEPPKKHVNENEPYFHKGSSISTCGYFGSPLDAGYMLSDRIEQFLAYVNIWSSIEFAWPRHYALKFKAAEKYFLYETAADFINLENWINPRAVPINRAYKLKSAYRTSKPFLEYVAHKPNANVRRVIRAATVLFESELTEDPKLRALLLWNCLEILFARDPSEDTKKLMKRANFFYSDMASMSFFLETLRDIRNDGVHAALRPAGAYQYGSLLDLIANHVRHVCRWIVLNSNRLPADRWFDLLELPRTSAGLASLGIAVQLASDIIAEREI